MQVLLPPLSHLRGGIQQVKKQKKMFPNYCTKNLAFSLTSFCDHLSSTHNVSSEDPVALACLTRIVLFRCLLCGGTDFCDKKRVLNRVAAFLFSAKLRILETTISHVYFIYSPRSPLTPTPSIRSLSPISSDEWRRKRGRSRSQSSRRSPWRWQTGNNTSTYKNNGIKIVCSQIGARTSATCAASAASPLRRRRGRTAARGTPLRRPPPWPRCWTRRGGSSQWRTSAASAAPPLTPCPANCRRYCATPRRRTHLRWTSTPRFVRRWRKERRVKRPLCLPTRYLL